MFLCFCAPSFSLVLAHYFLLPAHARFVRGIISALILRSSYPYRVSTLAPRRRPLTLPVSGRILVVGSHLQQLVSVLKEYGYHVIFAADQKECLAFARTYVPAFVLISEAIAASHPQLPFMVQQIVNFVEVFVL